MQGEWKRGDDSSFFTLLFLINCFSLLAHVHVKFNFHSFTRQYYFHSLDYIYSLQFFSSLSLSLDSITLLYLKLYDWNTEQSPLARRVSNIKMKHQQNEIHPQVTSIVSATHDEETFSTHEVKQTIRKSSDLFFVTKQFLLAKRLLVSNCISSWIDSHKKYLFDKIYFYSFH